ncbi:MAG: DNA oxidative demethylase AlkB [Methyloversatilis sp.]|uniref:DNA oxidative demethylase AlkB n=1 Tax=Methyloversatilis sp. TaxID=2569862 RepID=UPI00273468DD|nr:DNA oxidative demethylase AlkB [Methyloversatilis sp.]MDP3873779.1 DNA oxidative demethylase AlkB [Methyloversatilis sp.]
MSGLFDALERAAGPVTFAPGATLLRGFALADAAALLAAVDAIAAAAPMRHMVTPGGYTMSVATTSCGELGWTSDAQGYRYAARDPHSDLPWPAMPVLFRALARDAAAQAGFTGFEPDACLINRYAPGARLTLHQDRNERDFGAPIVSVSLGLPATFLFGGIKRTDPTLKLRLVHGDVVVWGGPARLRFHGVLPLARGVHPLTGDCRVNLTFRKAR